MPDGRVHGVIAATTGAGIGLMVAKDEPNYAQLLVALSAGVAGYAGGMLPDRLEPAEHPHHRDFYHSAAFGAGVLAGTAKPLLSARQVLFTAAAQRRALREQLPEDDPRRVRLALEEALCYVAVGLTVGIVAGYLSHVAADALTARSVPLVARRLL